MTYAEKLKDPRWQKRRLEVLERDGWACVRCGDVETTLHVHHMLYAPGGDPWDTEPMHLVTLCDTCHKIEHSERPDAEKRLLESFRAVGMFAEMLDDTAALMVRMKCHAPVEYMLGALLWMTKEPHRVDILARAYHCHIRDTLPDDTKNEIEETKQRLRDARTKPESE